MAKETKLLITRADCKKTLYDEVKSLIPITVTLTFMSIILILILIPFDRAFISYLRESSFDIYSVICIVGIVIFTVAFGGPLIYDIYIIAGLCRRMYDLKTGNFTIIEDTLAQIVIGEAEKKIWHKRTRYHNVFYFKNSGRYVVAGDRDRLLEYSSEGDLFYVVVFNNKKQEPLLLYHTNIYECKEAVVEQPTAPEKRKI